MEKFYDAESRAVIWAEVGAALIEGGRNEELAIMLTDLRYQISYQETSSKPKTAARASWQSPASAFLSQLALACFKFGNFTPLPAIVAFTALPWCKLNLSEISRKGG